MDSKSVPSWHPAMRNVLRKLMFEINAVNVDFIPSDLIQAVVDVAETIGKYPQDKASDFHYTLFTLLIDSLKVIQIYTNTYQKALSIGKLLFSISLLYRCRTICKEWIQRYSNRLVNTAPDYILDDLIFKFRQEELMCQHHLRSLLHLPEYVPMAGNERMMQEIVAREKADAFDKLTDGFLTNVKKVTPLKDGLIGGTQRLHDAGVASKKVSPSQREVMVTGPVKAASLLKDASASAHGIIVEVDVVESGDKIYVEESKRVDETVLALRNVAVQQCNIDCIRVMETMQTLVDVKNIVTPVYAADRHLILYSPDEDITDKDEPRIVIKTPRLRKKRLSRTARIAGSAYLKPVAYQTSVLKENSVVRDPGEAKENTFAKRKSSSKENINTPQEGTSKLLDCEKQGCVPKGKCQVVEKNSSKVNAVAGDDVTENVVPQEKGDSKEKVTLVDNECSIVKVGEHHCSHVAGSLLDAESSKGTISQGDVEQKGNVSNEDKKIIKEDAITVKDGGSSEVGEVDDSKKGSLSQGLDAVQEQTYIDELVSGKYESTTDFMQDQIAARLNEFLNEGCTYIYFVPPGTTNSKTNELQMKDLVSGKKCVDNISSESTEPKNKKMIQHTIKNLGEDQKQQIIDYCNGLFSGKTISKDILLDVDLLAPDLVSLSKQTKQNEEHQLIFCHQSLREAFKQLARVMEIALVQFKHLDPSTYIPFCSKMQTFLTHAVKFLETKHNTNLPLLVDCYDHLESVRSSFKNVKNLDKMESSQKERTFINATMKFGRTIKEAFEDINAIIFEHFYLDELPRNCLCNEVHVPLRLQFLDFEWRHRQMTNDLFKLTLRFRKLKRDFHSLTNEDLGHILLTLLRDAVNRTSKWGLVGAQCHKDLLLASIEEVLALYIIRDSQTKVGGKEYDTLMERKVATHAWLDVIDSYVHLKHCLSHERFGHVLTQIADLEIEPSLYDLKFHERLRLIKVERYLNEAPPNYKKTESKEFISFLNVDPSLADLRRGSRVHPFYVKPSLWERRKIILPSVKHKFWTKLNLHPSMESLLNFNRRDNVLCKMCLHDKKKTIIKMSDDFFILECLHILCIDCLDEWNRMDQENYGRSSPQCPTCYKLCRIWTTKTSFSNYKVSHGSDSVRQLRPWSK